MLLPCSGQPLKILGCVSKCGGSIACISQFFRATFSMTRVYSLKDAANGEYLQTISTNICSQRMHTNYFDLQNHFCCILLIRDLKIS